SWRQCAPGVSQSFGPRYGSSHRLFARAPTLDQAKISAPLDGLEHEEEDHGADEGDEDGPDVELVDPAGAGGVEQGAAEHGAHDAHDDREEAAPPIEPRDPGGQGPGDEAD